MQIVHADHWGNLSWYNLIIQINMHKNTDSFESSAALSNPVIWTLAN